MFMLRNVNGQQIDRIRKNIIKILKDIVFAIDVETSYKILYFLDVTFNLNNVTYRTYRKSKDLLSYINKSSNRPQQTVNQLPKTINERLSQKFLQ